LAVRNSGEAAPFVRGYGQDGHADSNRDRIIPAGTLTEIPGIGYAIANIITKLHQTGSHPSLEKLRKDVPEGVMELFAIPGIRPDKILKLHQELGISSLAELEEAAKQDRIRKVKGLGASLQTKMLQNLSIARSGQTQLHLHKAAALLEHATATVKQQHPEYSRIEIAGDFRRGSELVTELALVAETRKPSGSEEISGGLKLALTDKKHYGAKLLHATGSAEHLKQLVALAHDKGLELRPDGLYRGKKLIASATEKEIYKALDLQFIEPELREGRDEIKRAARHKLPKLVSDKDLHGILHCHTRVRRHRDAGDHGKRHARAWLRVFWRRGPFHIRPLCGRSVARRDRRAAPRGRPTE
jgi:DNA polymerase (family 10)